MGFLEQLKWNKGVVNQYKAAISGSMCYTIMGAATAWPSPVLSKMATHEAPMILDVPQTSLMVSLMFLGHISSPLPSGYLMDIFGRKKTCICLSILPFVSWLLIFIASSPFHLYIARYAAGLWIGITTTIMPIYVGEIAGPKLRNSLTTINNLLLNFGVLFVYLIGSYVNYYYLAVACEIFTIVFFCLFISMPESPVFLLKQNKKEDAFEVLCWLRAGEARENIENEIWETEISLEDQKLQKGTLLREIFMDSGNRKAFFISVTYSVLKRLSGSSVMQAFASITLPQESFGVLDPDSCVVIIGFVSCLSSVAATGLAVKFCRRTLLTISCGGCAFSTALLAMWFYLYRNTSSTLTNYSDVICVSFILYYSVFNIGLGPIGTSIKGEIFSTSVKALSSSLTTVIVAFTGFMVNEFYLIIAQSAGMYINYTVYSVSCVVAIMFTWLYVPDTHNKTLEEIRRILRGDTKMKNYQSIS